MRRLFYLVALAVIGTELSIAQTAKFEVVSVKENRAVGKAGIVSGPNHPGQFSFINIPLRTIIIEAFNVQDYELVGLPNWARTTKYDVIGKYPDGANPQAQHLEMIQNMLADRFQLKWHREPMEKTVYRLIVARADRRLGPMLVPSDVDCKAWRAEQKPQIGAGGNSVVSPSGKRDACIMSAQRNWIVGGTQPISMLTWFLEDRLGTRVVDRTGLEGNFDMDLAWTIEPGLDVIAGGLPANPSAPLSSSILTAVQDQLGLKLEPSKEKIQALVIESVSRPTPD